MRKTGTTSRWCQVWRDGLQLEIPETAETLHLDVAMWRRWRVVIAKMEEIAIAIAIAPKEMATVVAPTSMRMLARAETMPAALNPHLMLPLTEINSPSLT